MSRIHRRASLDLLPVNRRDYLTLLASAPIAALAPWPKILAMRTAPIMFRADAFKIAMSGVATVKMGVVPRLDVVQGVGYFRSSVEPSGELGITRRMIAAYDPEQDRQESLREGALQLSAWDLAAADSRDLPFVDKLTDAYAFLKSRIN